MFLIFLLLFGSSQKEGERFPTKPFSEKTLVHLHLVQLYPNSGIKILCQHPKIQKINSLEQIRHAGPTWASIRVSDLGPGFAFFAL
jgi:hypothetical protein